MAECLPMNMSATDVHVPELPLIPCTSVSSGDSLRCPGSYQTTAFALGHGVQETVCAALTTQTSYRLPLRLHRARGCWVPHTQISPWGELLQYCD